MKKIAYILGAVVLATGSVSAVASFAQDATANALSTNIVNAAKATEATDRSNGVTDPSKLASDVAAAVAAAVQAGIDAGDSNAEISAAMTEAENTPGLSSAVSAGLTSANTQVASLETNRPAAQGTAGTGGGGAATPPSPPPPAAAGSGYTGH